ncbi:hypothetical protein [Phenylobacterium sp.]|uniref:hypothetical protein n=1 Tax=Phenylobacterium sp. TaxID=1871053 RepID=UPI0027362030|nr:hypothetical protein [Phenylobacterium sp.]MDP3632509.1 hypothetical protein [Phenylobacterium sp.]
MGSNPIARSSFYVKSTSCPFAHANAAATVFAQRWELAAKQTTKSLIYKEERSAFEAVRSATRTPLIQWINRGGRHRRSIEVEAQLDLARWMNDHSLDYVVTLPQHAENRTQQGSLRSG